MSEQTPVERHEEHHVTVAGVDPIDWYNFCHEHNVKPLYIELSNMNLQLMCETDQDPAELIELFGAEFPEGRVVRVKHEVNVMNEDERPRYYECHVKIDGPMLTGNASMASRDLYRANRWYLTKRSPSPFSAEDFVAGIKRRLEHRSNQSIAGFEYEVCVSDTNEALDAGWAR